ncbi:MAG: sulfite exporter TauE/SafE family protein [Acidimicrobiales bacterium]
MEWTLVLASAVVGVLVGATGAGGGALMTPMLILVFGVSPSAAISSDLVAALVMRPVGAAVHWRRGTVNWALVRWLAAGSVPAAVVGSFLLHVTGGGSSKDLVETILGAALLAGAFAMIIRSVLQRRRPTPTVAPQRVAVRPLPTVAVGVLGGLLVGMTSVGAGSLMIVLLLCLYPAVASSALVGTDLVQAIPLTAAAALGQLLFGHVELAVTAALVVGSVPAVLVGSLLSSRAPDRLLRPVIGFAILASGLKYVGVPTTALAAVLGGIVVVATVLLAVRRLRQPVTGTAPVPVGAGPLPFGDAIAHGPLPRA